MADTETRVIAVITKELGEQHIQRARPDLTVDSRLADFGIDWLDLACISCAIDEEFSIELPDTAVEGWATVGDVVASVAALVTPAAADWEA